jgi:hypothetical protein
MGLRRHTHRSKSADRISNEKRSRVQQSRRKCVRLCSSSQFNLCQRIINRLKHRCSQVCSRAWEFAVKEREATLRTFHVLRFSGHVVEEPRRDRSRAVAADSADWLFARHQQRAQASLKNFAGIWLGAGSQALVSIRRFLITPRFRRIATGAFRNQSCSSNYVYGLIGVLTTPGQDGMHFALFCGCGKPSWSASMLVHCSEQVLPLTADANIGFIDAPDPERSLIPHVGMQ